MMVRTFLQQSPTILLVAYPEQQGSSVPPPYGVSPYPAQPAQPAHTAYVMPVQPVSNPPSDYLVWSIITTVFCCFWFGIAAIIKSVRARDAISNGKLRIIVLYQFL